jgi:hypothetical protein
VLEVAMFSGRSEGVESSGDEAPIVVLRCRVVSPMASQHIWSTSYPRTYIPKIKAEEIVQMKGSLLPLLKGLSMAQEIQPELDGALARVPAVQLL